MGNDLQGAVDGIKPQPWPVLWDPDICHAVYQWTPGCFNQGRFVVGCGFIHAFNKQFLHAYYCYVTFNFDVLSNNGNLQDYNEKSLFMHISQLCMKIYYYLCVFIVYIIIHISLFMVS